MVDRPVKSTTKSFKTPYPPSWIDRLIVWIDRLPGPAWLFYLASAVLFALLFTATLWIDGSLPFGTLDLNTTSFAVFVMYWTALYQFLTRIGAQSLEAFRPLLVADDIEFARINYELANLPRQAGWLSIVIGIAFAVVTVSSEPSTYGEISPQTALVRAVDLATTMFLSITFFCVVLRSIRQLRMVSRIQARATNINLLKLKPAHAFSRLTAWTGVGLILILIYGYISDPFAFSTGVDVLTYVLTALLAIAVFILPIRGMRELLEDQKESALDENSDLLQAIRKRFHGLVSDGDLDELKAMDVSINTLISERQLIKGISTWPWDPRTVRGFGSTLLLPIFLWLVTRWLEGIL